LDAETILEVKDLYTAYYTDDGVVEANNGVNLMVKRGESLGLVGETGAGKTTLAKGIMRLLPTPPARILRGEILFNGKELLNLSEPEMRKIRGAKISMIFQDPMTSLNPYMTVRSQIEEVLQAHGRGSRAEARRQADEMLELVGIMRERGDDYPHQFSGGMKQRVVIAIALACSPELLIADEPTTALDVTIQHQVLTMIANLKKERDTSMIIITHDLGIVAQNCDNVAIMYAGKIVEYGSLREVFKDARHPYTKGLFGSIPSLVRDVHRLKPIQGQVPDPTRLPTGCKFHPRCDYATEECKELEPEMFLVGGTHRVRCLLEHQNSVQE
jgi:peptide/nickel transport system ATP-binding protein